MAKHLIYLLFIFGVMACTRGTKYSDETIKNELRAPSYPLLSLHPQVRLWSSADKLTDRNITFTNGKTFPFVGFLRVDDVIYRFMGSEEFLTTRLILIAVLSFTYGIIIGMPSAVECGLHARVLVWLYPFSLKIRSTTGSAPFLLAPSIFSLVRTKLWTTLALM